MLVIERHLQFDVGAHIELWVMSCHKQAIL